MEGHASLDHGENDGENAVIGNHAALGDRADAGGKSTITAAEKRVLQNMKFARTLGRFRRLRLAVVLAILMISEQACGYYGFQASLTSAGVSPHDARKLFQVSWTNRSLHLPVLHYVLLALVPTDRRLVRLTAVGIVVSCIGVWISELYAIFGCPAANMTSDGDQWVEIVATAGLGCSSDSVAGLLGVRASMGGGLMLVRLIAAFSFPITAALAARALILRVERTAGGKAFYLWRDPTHYALQRLWVALTVSFVYGLHAVV